MKIEILGGGAYNRLTIEISDGEDRLRDSFSIGNAEYEMFTQIVKRASLMFAKHKSDKAIREFLGISQ